MNLAHELERLIDVLAAKGVEYALCGGMAVNVYGHVRATKDIDLMIESISLETVSDALAAIGFNLRSGKIPFGFGTPQARELWRVSKSGPDGSLLSVDLLIATPILEAVWSERTQVEWSNRTLSIVSLDGLATMKRLAGRAQDRADLEALGLE